MLTAPADNGTPSEPVEYDFQKVDGTELRMNPVEAEVASRWLPCVRGQDLYWGSSCPNCHSHAHQPHHGPASGLKHGPAVAREPP